MELYKVAIIGAGSIGANKPDTIDSPITENILTHAHAVFHHPRTELYAIVDTDPIQLEKAVKKWQPKRAFLSLDDLEVDPEKSDIIIVAVPTEWHYPTLVAIHDLFQPRLVICEKPFCGDLKQAISIQNQYAKKQVSIMVNYIRRFSAGHQEIKNNIDTGKYGKALNCRVLYTRGLKHDGCHALDLLNWFFGRCLYNHFDDCPGSIIDRSASDPTIYAKLIFEDCKSVVLQPCDGRKYGIFEIDICFENARVRLIDNGLYFETYPINEINEWGHKSLSYKLTEVLRRETGLNFAMYHLINNAVDFLDKKTILRCYSKNAIDVHKIIEDRIS